MQPVQPVQPQTGEAVIEQPRRRGAGTAAASIAAGGPTTTAGAACPTAASSGGSMTGAGTPSTTVAVSTASALAAASRVPADEVPAAAAEGVDLVAAAAAGERAWVGGDLKKSLVLRQTKRAAATASPAAADRRGRGQGRRLGMRGGEKGEGLIGRTAREGFESKTQLVFHSKMRYSTGGRASNAE